MELVSTTPPTPNSATTTIADPTATPSWQRVQYRAQLVTADDAEHAGFAVPSLPSMAYALLVPPPPLATPMLTPNVFGTTPAVSLVSVATTAQRLTTDVGDHMLSLVVTLSDPIVRFSSPLNDLKVFPSEAALVASSEAAAYVQQGLNYTLYLRLARQVNQDLQVMLDLADPLGRTTHVSLAVPYALPDPPPQLAGLTLTRQAGVIFGNFTGNTPPTPDPAHPWHLSIAVAGVSPPTPPQSRSFDVAAIPSIASPAAMPTPAANPAQQFMIAQVAGTSPSQFLFWLRSAVRLLFAVQLTNSLNQSATDQQVSL
jgi:hypothetical protein